MPKMLAQPLCQWFLFVLILCIHFSLGSPPRSIKVPEVHHLKGYRSPLDEGLPAAAESDFGTSAEKNLAESVDFAAEDGMQGLLLPGLGGPEVPLCQKECLSKFSQAVKTAMQSGNNFDRFKGVCRNYNETVYCMDKLEGERCSNQETFHVFTSGIRYICIEQRKAFDSVIECIDAQSTEVEKECEEVCHVKERLAHWAVQSGIMDNFMQGALSSLANGESVAAKLFGRGEGIGSLMGLQHRRSGGKPTNNVNVVAQQSAAIGPAANAFANAAADKDRAGAEKLLGEIAMPKPQGAPLSKRLTPDFLRAVVQDGCELMRCQLICYRVKFDAKCGGSAGALLSEAFVRPISQAQEFLTYGHFAPFMGAFLPHQCDFMVKKEVLNEFRIPPELDDALHRKYNNPQKGDGEETVAAETEGHGQSAVSKKTPMPEESEEEEGKEGDSEVQLKKHTEEGQSANKKPKIEISKESGEDEEEDNQMGRNVSAANPGNRSKVSHVVGSTQ